MILSFSSPDRWGDPLLRGLRVLQEPRQEDGPNVQAVQWAAVPAGPLRLRDAGGQVGVGDGGGTEATEPWQERGRGADPRPQGQQPPQVPQAGRISLPGLSISFDKVTTSFTDLMTVYQQRMYLSDYGILHHLKLSIWVIKLEMLSVLACINNWL